MKNNSPLQNLVSRVAERLSLRSESSLLAEQKPRPLVLEALEPRILFSGSPAPAPEPAPQPEADTVQAAPAQETTAAPVTETDAAAVETTVAAPAATVDSTLEGETVAVGSTNDAPADVQGEGETAIALTDAEVDALADAATQIWVASGITAEQSAILASATYRIADLGGNILGAAEGNLITIDDDAAGRGWFVDSTPGESGEFELGASITGSSTNGVDLLTAILHEQGHLLGLDGHEGATADDIMFEFLGLGERRLPEAGEAAGAHGGELEETHFLTLAPATADFEGLTEGDTTFQVGGDPEFTLGGDLRVSQFANLGSGDTLGFVDTFNNAPTPNAGGSVGTITIVDTGAGESFEINSIDIALSDDAGAADPGAGTTVGSASAPEEVTFTGTLAAGGTVSHTLTLDYTPNTGGYQTVDFTGTPLDDEQLSSVEIFLSDQPATGAADFVFLDNFAYTADDGNTGGGGGSSTLVASFDFGAIQETGEPTNADGLIIPGQIGGWTQAPLTGTGNFSSTATTANGITWTWNPGAVETVSAWPNGGTDELRRDYYALLSPSRYSGPVTWELTGLTPNGTYDLVMFSLNAAQQGYFSIPGHDAGNGVGNNVTNDSEGDGNFTGVVADGTGKISGLMDVTGTAWATLAGLQLAEVAPAATVLLDDSFEDPDISPATSSDEPEPTGWFDEGHPNTAGIIDESHSGGTFFSTPYGNQAMKVWQGNQGGAQRVLGTVEGDKEYTVTFNVVPRDGRANGDYRVELVSVAGATVNVLASVEGFVTTNDMSEGDSFTLVTTAAHPDVGKELRIRLVDPAAGQVTAPWQDGPYYDNLKVTIADAAPSADTTAPIPDPSTWDVVPTTGTNYGVITMTADTASDPNGVQYFFENTTTNSNSGWQDGNTWTETSLGHGATYDYRVQTRDFIGNVGGWSSVESATTLAVPAGTTVDIDSFESPDITGSTTDNPTGWNHAGHPNGAGIIDVDTGVFTTPFGEQALTVWQGSGADGVWRSLGNLEDKDYTVTFQASARDNRPVGDYRAQLFTVDSGGAVLNVLATAEGTVTTNDMSEGDTLTFAPGSGHSDLGEELRLRFIDPAAGEITAPWQDGPLYDYVIVKVAPPAPALDAVDDDYTTSDPTDEDTVLNISAPGVLANDIGGGGGGGGGGGATPGADITVTSVNDSNQGAFAAEVSNSDLLDGLLGPQGGTWHGTQNSSFLNNGVHGSVGGGDDFGQIAWAQSAGATVTYDLGLGTGGLGYDLTEITSFGAWGSAGFGNQGYTVEVKLKDEAAFTELETVLYNPHSGGGATKVTLTDGSGVLASGVELIRFTHNAIPNSSGGGATYRELDVFGTETTAGGGGATITAFDAVSAEGAAVTVNPDGSFSYDPTGSSTLQALNDGEMLVDTFTYTISESSGPTVDILSSEDAEGETATYFLQTSANGPSANVEYQLPGTFQHNNTWLQANTASVGGAAEGSDPTGQHILTRSTTGNMVLSNPLALATGGYDSVTVDFAVNVRYSVDTTALFLDYSANGDFTDSVNVLTIGSTANGSGTAYEEDRWYAGQSVMIEDGVGGITFTDTANFRWRSGGFANSTQILLDDIVISGIAAGGGGGAVNPLTGVTYVYDGTGDGSQPQPTGFQSGLISDVGNVKLTDGALATGGWNDGTHAGFRDDTDDGTAQPQVTFDLGGTQDVQTIDIHSNIDFAALDSVVISTSTDGTTFDTPTTYALTFSTVSGKLTLATVDVSALPDASHYRLDFRQDTQWAMINEVTFNAAPPQNTDTATVSIRVDGVNDGPDAVDDDYTASNPTDEDTVLTISTAPSTLLTLDSMATGNHSFTADGQTFDAYVEQHDGAGWLLIGRGREGWEFDTDGQGNVADVNQGVGTSTAFAPAAYSDAMINDLLANVGLTMADVEIRVSRASAPDGSGDYQDVRWRDFSGNGDAFTFNLEDSQFAITTEHVNAPAGLAGAQTGVNTNSNTRDSGLGGNDADRIFTWAWNNHGSQKGFSYGSSVGNGTNNATTYIWENGNENHAIPYAEVYIRALNGTQTPASQSVLDNDTPVAVPAVPPALVTGVTIEDASSFFPNDGRLPEDAINQVGLNVGAGTHNNDPRDMWLSNNEEAPVITFDLEDNYDLGSLHVWNYNENSGNPAAFTARGANEVEILVAETVGGAFTSLGTYNFAQADGTNTYAGEDITLSGADNVRLIRFDIKSDHGGDNYTGLSEVQFFTAGTPEVPGASIVAFDAVSANGAAVAVNPDGTFTYDPTGSATLQGLNDGDSVDDTFTYTITDSITVGTGPLDWNFSNDSLNGWTVLNGLENFSGNGVSASLANGNFAHDGGHETFLIESPEFRFDGTTLDGTNALIVGFEGGQGNQGGSIGAFATPEEVLAFNSGNSAGNGLKGLALYNTATGQYESTLFDPQNGGASNQEVGLAAAGLDTDATYRLHFYENDQGGWGWTRLNRAQVAGGELVVGTTDTATVTVSVSGINDAPVGVDDYGSVTETADAITNPQATGNVLTNDTDVDNLPGDLSLVDVNGDAGNLGATLTGTFGSVVINSDGSYTYTLDDSDPDTQALMGGQAATETFEYSVSDGSGGPTVDILSSEDGEGETATHNLQTSANGPSTNIEYQLPGTFQHNNTWLQAHTASVGGAAEGSDPTGQHILTRSTTGNMVLRDPLALASGGYDSVTVDFAVNVRYSVDTTALFLDYSANGTFSDSVNVLTIGSTANGSGTAYEEDRWYAGQSVMIENGVGGINFTDTANFRWRSGGFANSTQILLDDIVISGIAAGGGGGGATDTATLTVTVTGANDSPVATDDAFSVLEDDGIAQLGNLITGDNGSGADSDVDSTSLTIVGFDFTGLVGSATVAGSGDFSYDPNGQFESLADGETATDTFTYTISDDGVAFNPGLVAGTLSGNIDTTTPNPGNQGISLDLSDANNGIGGNTTEVYTGQFYDADGVVSFREHIDDKTWLMVDGQVVLNNGQWNVETNSATLNLTPGWVDFELRISNGGGGAGPVGGVGFEYDPDGGTNWSKIQDGAGSSILRHAVPAPAEDTATVTVTVTGQNDAPVLSGSNGFDGVAVNDPNNDGNLVSELTGTITDVDNGALIGGIAVVDATIDIPGAAIFEYSRDGGTTWTDVNDTVAVDGANGLLLLPTDRIRFSPNGTQQVTGSIEFKAWDQTGGTFGAEGTKVNTVPDGGESPFSTFVGISTVTTVNATIENGALQYGEEEGRHDEVTIWSDGTSVYIHDNAGPVTTDDGTQIDPNTVSFLIADFEDLRVEANDFDDTITVGDMPDFHGSLTIDGEDGFDSVKFASGMTLELLTGTENGPGDESLTVGAETVKIDLDAAISVVGTGGIDIDATGGGTEDFIGLQVKRATLTSEGGDITLDGEGGSVGKNNDGVLLSHGSSVTATDGGSVTITGTGTSAAGSNDGVSLLGGSDITVSGAGAIALTGESSGVSDSYGVQLFRGTTLASEDGDITLAGTSVSTGARNSGIYTNTATVTTAGSGSIALDGEGSGGGSHNKGLRLAATELTAAGTGGITLTGTGGAGTSSNVGVQVGVRTTLATDSGDVTITGEGTGSTSKNAGVAFLSKSSVGSGGDLTVTGTAGDGTSHNDGVSLTSASLSATGGLTVTGEGNGSSSYNRGIDSTNSTFGGAGVTLAGTGSTGSASGRFNDGVYLNRGGATAAGTLTINATGGTGSSDNRGFYASRVDLAGTLAITGTADAATTGVRNTGVFVQNSTLAAGSITGTGGGGTGSFGAYMQNILGGLTSTSVTTNPLNDETERKGNFFPAILPLLMAEADRRTTRRKGETGETLRELFARLRGTGGVRGAGGTPVFRSLDGHITLDPLYASPGSIDAALEVAGIDIPQTAETSRRTIVLNGDDGEPLSGVVAYADETGDVVTSHPLGADHLSTGEFVGILRGLILNSEGRPDAPWSGSESAPATSPSGFENASHALSKSFGIE